MITNCQGHKIFVVYVTCTVIYIQYQHTHDCASQPHQFQHASKLHTVSYQEYKVSAAPSSCSGCTCTGPQSQW